MCWAPVWVYNAYHVLVLGWFNMLTVQVRNDDCVGNKYSDIEAQLMRRGGKLPVPTVAIMFCNCQTLSGASREASLCGQP